MSNKKTKLSREDNARTVALLKFLTSKPESYEFLKPVDYRRLGLTDYPDIVKQPMDISTIKRKIKNGAYADFDAVLEDVMLIWANCKLYNPVHLPVHQQAITMEEHTREFLKKEQPPIPKKRGREELSNDSKLQLIQALKNLAEEEIGEIVELIYAICPKALLKTQDDKYQVVIDKMDTSSFQQVLE